MKISVCMATYNGSKYIEKQILSILNQLKNEDELIIVDDGSKDHTVKIIENFADSRIVIIKNEVNQGVINTFEKSLQAATGELIFLSDQDDIWLPNKVDKITAIFKNYPHITLIHHDAQIINKQDQVISESRFQSKPLFLIKLMPTLIKNNYMGCTMAFQKKILSKILPFPEDIPMHDIWIGLINELYGNIFYIKESLIQRRVHDTNFTPGLSPESKKSSLIQKIKWRLSLVKNLLKFVLKNYS